MQLRVRVFVPYIMPTIALDLPQPDSLFVFPLREKIFCLKNRTLQNFSLINVFKKRKASDEELVSSIYEDLSKLSRLSRWH